MAIVFGLRFRFSGFSTFIFLALRGPFAGVLFDRGSLALFFQGSGLFDGGKRRECEVVLGEGRFLDGGSGALVRVAGSLAGGRGRPGRRERSGGGTWLSSSRFFVEGDDTLNS